VQILLEILELDSDLLRLFEMFLAQCYGQFGELKDWRPKLLSSIRRTESKESEFTKSSSAIWSAANCVHSKISSTNALLLISLCHQYCITALEMVNRFSNSKVEKILGGPLTPSCSKLLVTSAGCWDEMHTGGEWRTMVKSGSADLRMSQPG